MQNLLIYLIENATIIFFIVAQAVTGSKKDDSDEESLSQSSASPKQSIKPIKHHTKKDKRKNPTQVING